LIWEGKKKNCFGWCNMIFWTIGVKNWDKLRHFVVFFGYITIQYNTIQCNMIFEYFFMIFWTIGGKNWEKLRNLVVFFGYNTIQYNTIQCKYDFLVFFYVVFRVMFDMGGENIYIYIGWCNMSFRVFFGRKNENFAKFGRFCCIVLYCIDFLPPKFRHFFQIFSQISPYAIK